MKLGHWPKCQKLHIYSLSTPGGRNWAYFCSTGMQWFPRYGPIFKIGHIWAWNLAIAQICTYTGTPFLSQGVKFELIFALWAAVSEIWADFQTCHIWAWNLAIGQSSRSCIYTFFLPQDGDIGLIFALRAAVSEIRADFQNCHIWAWNLAISHSSRSCTYTLNLPQGVKIQFNFALRAGISEKRADFQNCHIWAWKWPEKFQKLHIYSLSTIRGQNWAYFCSAGSSFWDKGRFSKLPYLGMKLGHWPKFQNLHIYFLSTPGGAKLSLFSL